MVQLLTSYAHAFIPSRVAEVNRWATDSAASLLCLTSLLDNAKQKATLEITAYNFKIRQFNLYNLGQLAAIVIVCNSLIGMIPLYLGAVGTAAVVYCIFQATIYEAAFQGQNILSDYTRQQGYIASSGEKTDFGVFSWRPFAVLKHVSQQEVPQETKNQILSTIRAILNNLNKIASKEELLQEFEAFSFPSELLGFKDRLRPLFKIDDQEMFLNLLSNSLHTFGEMNAFMALMRKINATKRKELGLTPAQKALKKKLEQIVKRETLRTVREVLDKYINSGPRRLITKDLEQRLRAVVNDASILTSEDFVARFVTAAGSNSEYSNIEVFDTSAFLDSLYPEKIGLSSAQKAVIKEYASLQMEALRAIQDLGALTRESLLARLVSLFADKALLTADSFAEAFQDIEDVKAWDHFFNLHNPLPLSEEDYELLVTKLDFLNRPLSERQRKDLHLKATRMLSDVLRERLLKGFGSEDDLFATFYEALQTKGEMVQILQICGKEGFFFYSEVTLAERLKLSGCSVKTIKNTQSPLRVVAFREMLEQHCSLGIPAGFNEVIQKTVTDQDLKARLLKARTGPPDGFVERFMAELHADEELDLLHIPLQQFFGNFERAREKIFSRERFGIGMQLARFTSQEVQNFQKQYLAACPLASESAIASIFNQPLDKWITLFTETLITRADLDRAKYVIEHSYGPSRLARDKKELRQVLEAMALLDHLFKIFRDLCLQDPACPAHLKEKIEPLKDSNDKQLFIGALIDHLQTKEDVDWLEGKAEQVVEISKKEEASQFDPQPLGLSSQQMLEAQQMLSDPAMVQQMMELHKMMGMPVLTDGDGNPVSPEDFAAFMQQMLSGGQPQS